MKQSIELKLAPEEGYDEAAVRAAAVAKLSLPADAPDVSVVLRRRSIDARGRSPVVVIGAEVFAGELPAAEPPVSARYKTPRGDRRVIIVGAGPAGYFAALELIELGIMPVVLDRGKDVRARRRDLRAIQQFGIVNPHSNYCFGEGGAGTYSDGKLYTRSVKRGDIRKPLRQLVEHGATPDILVETHPHIGSNKLPGVVSAIRETIERFGGTVRFDSHVTDFLIENGVMRGVVVNGAEELTADAVILATGHSARDVFHLCHRRGVTIEAKPFAMGVRIEHPQSLIDDLQYRQNPRSRFLPASSYRVAEQIDNRGVYSFCMCPGGLIVPAATAPGETVVNGMSMSRRDSRFANSGMVVEITHGDLEQYASHGVFAGLAYQQELERIAFAAGGDETQTAPAQRVVDFANGKTSASMPGCSYIPGLHSAPLHEILPPQIGKRLQRALPLFGKRMKGYFSNDAVVVGVESRTSSPVKIPRRDDTLEHISTQRLFPCGEGAGYAGGIISAAMDGQRVAQAVAGVIL